jgi:hypothetical protein
MRRYRILRKREFPGGILAQVKLRWLPGWRTLANCGLSEDWARSVIENHRNHGTIHDVLHCDPRPTPEAKERT